MKVIMERKGLKDQLEAEGCSSGGVDSARRLYNHYIQIAVCLLKMTNNITPLIFQATLHPFCQLLETPSKKALNDTTETLKIMVKSIDSMMNRTLYECKKSFWKKLKTIDTYGQSLLAKNIDSKEQAEQMQHWLAARYGKQ